MPRRAAIERGPGTLIGLAVVLAACAAPGAGESPGATDDASPTATTSAAPEVAELCPPALEPGAPVEPGEYRASHMDPPITLSIPDGTWTIDCTDESFVMFGGAGGMAVVGDVRTIGRGGEPNPVEPTADAVLALMTELGVEFTDPETVEVAGREAFELTVTPDEAGMGFRNEHDRGWGFTADDGGIASVTLVPAGDTLLVFIRHGDEPAFGEVISSVQIED